MPPLRLSVLTLQLLDLLRDFKNDEREVMVELIRILEHTSDALVSERARRPFQRYVSSLLLRRAKKIGWDGKPGESESDRLLRRVVFQGLANLTADPWLVREASKRARKLMRGSGKVNPDTAGIALQVAARHGDASVAFDKLVAKLEASQNPGRRVQLVLALGSYADAATLKRAFGLLLDGTVRSQDAVYLMRGALRWNDTRVLFVAWLQEHLRKVAKRFPMFGVGRMVGSLGRVCDAKLRKAAAQRIEPVVSELQASPRRLAEALERSAQCIELHASQLQATTAYFANNRFLRRRR